MAAIAGQYITDGTAIFILRDIRDGTPVGRPITDDILRDGYVKRNGALLQRSSYPTLVKFLQDNASLVTTEANWPNAKNMWTWGDGTSTAGTTIRVPDDRGQYEQLSDSVGIMEAGIPNIEGEIYVSTAGGIHGSFINGKGSLMSVNGANRTRLGGTTAGEYQYGLGLDASKSSTVYGNSTTVTPPSVRRIAQMKY